MPTRRTKRGATPRDNGSVLTPGILNVLEFGSDMLGEFAHLHLSDNQLEKKIEALWKIHWREATKSYIGRFPGTRPLLWWKHNAPGAGRPIVRPFDSEKDRHRFDEERRVQDLAFLIRHKLLTREEEKAILAAKKKEEELKCG